MRYFGVSEIGYSWFNKGSNIMLLE